MNNEQMKAMRNLQELAFQMQEAALFLDSHPTNSAALRYYQKAAGAYHDAMTAYTAMYGPVTVTGGVNDHAGGDWGWVRGPWPWELSFPNNTDEMSASEHGGED